MFERRFRRLFVTALVVGTGALALVACSDDHGHEEDGHGHGELPASCQSIVDACHTKVTGPGEIDDCHEIGHEGDEGACDTAVAEGCVELCDAAPDAEGDAGSADGGY